jgi:squalene-hopene/tetraprenyl-beta-curcumene cyclase
MWTIEREDGAWDWLKCGWPPYEHHDYDGALFAAPGVAAAPDGYRESEAARHDLGRLRRHLRAPPPSLHHEAMLSWAATTSTALRRYRP